MERLAGSTGFNQQLRRRIQANAGNPAYGAKAAAFAEQREDGGALFGRELIHSLITCLSAFAIEHYLHFRRVYVHSLHRTSTEAKLCSASCKRAKPF